MKALTVRMPWAHLIAEGIKTVEVRSWATKYRGPLLICAGKTPADLRGMVLLDLPDTKPTWRMEDLGHALAIVNVVSCTAMAEVHEKAALVRARPGLYAWGLDNVRKVEAFPVVGKQGFFEVDYEG